MLPAAKSAQQRKISSWFWSQASSLMQGRSWQSRLLYPECHGCKSGLSILYLLWWSGLGRHLAVSTNSQLKLSDRSPNLVHSISRESRLSAKDTTSMELGQSITRSGIATFRCLQLGKYYRNFPGMLMPTKLSSVQAPHNARKLKSVCRLEGDVCKRLETCTVCGWQILRSKCCCCVFSCIMQTSSVNGSSQACVYSNEHCHSEALIFEI